MPAKDRPRLGRLQPSDVVGVVLAIGMALAINLFIVAAALEARGGTASLPIGLSDNATQVLTGWGGGIIGVIGALVGYRVGSQKTPTPPPDEPEEPRPDGIVPPYLRKKASLSTDDLPPTP